MGRSGQWRPHVDLTEICALESEDGELPSWICGRTPLLGDGYLYLLKRLVPLGFPAGPVYCRVVAR